MRNHFFLSLIMSCFLISCQKTESSICNDVDIQIINKQINSVGDSTIFTRTKLAYNLKEKNEAKNIITYKISNKSKNKYYFVLDEDAIEAGNQYDLNACLYCKKSKLFYNINTIKNGKPKYVSSRGDSFETLNNKCNAEIYKTEEVRFKLSELNYLDNGYDYEFYNLLRKNSFILYPNQTKYFQSIVYLPLKESNYYDNNTSYFIFKNEIKYNFNLVYIVDESLVKKNLPDYKLKELKENNIKVFHGKLVSNKVPIKFIH